MVLALDSRLIYVWGSRELRARGSRFQWRIYIRDESIVKRYKRYKRRRDRAANGILRDGTGIAELGTRGAALSTITVNDENLRIMRI